MTRHRTEQPGLPSPEALFRFQVVSEVRARMLRGEVRADAVATVAARPHPTGPGPARRVSERTVYRWLAAFELDALAGLEPASRVRTDSSVVLAPELLDFVAGQKTKDPRASLPELIRRARLLGLVAEDAAVDRSTLWRACQRLGVATDRRKKAKDHDSRRFAYPHRMDLLLCDGKHFRAGPNRAKRVAFFYLDDATRFGLHVVVGTTETKALFLRGLYETIRRYGVSSIVFIDGGPGFVAHDTIAVVQSLPALLIHGQAGYPEGHGKIEKFNQTALGAVLRTLDRRPDVDSSLGALELRLGHWLRETYNHTPHESLGHKVTPWQRFSGDATALRLPDSDAALRERFVIHRRRRISKDHVASIDGTDYEVPRGHAGRRVLLVHQVLDDTVRMQHAGRLVTLQPVDLAANARARRGRGEPETETTHPLPKSAADMAFDRDFLPVVGPDGGFHDESDP